MSKKRYIVPLLALLCIIVLLILGPIPQDQNYHHFADQRKLLSVPNFLNVITNLPFAVIGLLGLRATSKIVEYQNQVIVATLFYGFLLLTLGSGYYHLRPENFTLVFGRIPIVIIIMSFFAYIIYSSIDKVAGYTCFFVLNILGVLSVMFWAISESAGKGDLRWYGMMHFFRLLQYL